MIDPLLRDAGAARPAAERVHAEGAVILAIKNRPDGGARRPARRHVAALLRSAVLPSRFGTDEEGRRLAERWRTVALDQIVQFSSLDDPVNGRKRKRK